MTDTCLNCGQPVRRINYALGPELMHVEPSASFPTIRKGTAWRHCRTQVATVDQTPHTHGGTDAPECTPYGTACASDPGGEGD